MITFIIGLLLLIIGGVAYGAVCQQKNSGCQAQ